MSLTRRQRLLRALHAYFIRPLPPPVAAGLSELPFRERLKLFRQAMRIARRHRQTRIALACVILALVLPPIALIVLHASPFFVTVQILCAAFASGWHDAICKRHQFTYLLSLFPGRCPTCGYDLRATPTRCPECGTPPAPAHHAETK